MAKPASARESRLGLPRGPLDLLAKAALAPPEIAREAWSEWRRGIRLDETPWNEVRMLGSIAPRLKWLEKDASIAPRILGIRKFLYAQTQMCLMGAMDGLRALSDGRGSVYATERSSPHRAQSSLRRRNGSFATSIFWCGRNTRTRHSPFCENQGGP